MPVALPGGPHEGLEEFYATIKKEKTPNLNPLRLAFDVYAKMCSSALMAV